MLKKAAEKVVLAAQGAIPKLGPQRLLNIANKPITPIEEIIDVFTKSSKMATTTKTYKLHEKIENTTVSKESDTQVAINLLQKGNTSAGFVILESIYKSGQELSVSTLAQVISHSKDSPPAWMTTASEKFLEKKNISSDAMDLQIVYNFLLERHRYNLKRLLEIFQDMLLKEIEPSKLTIAHVFLGYSAAQRMDKAMEMMEEMLRKGWPLGKFLVCYSGIIRHLVKSGDLEAAMKMKRDMEADNQKTPRQVYDLLIVGLAKQGNLNAAFELKREMENKRMLLSSIACNELLFVFSRDHFQHILDMKKEMDQRRLVLFPVSYRFIIHAAIKHSTQMAKLWFEELRTKHPTHVHQHTIRVIIRLYLKEGETKKAVDLYTELQPSMDTLLTVQLEALKQQSEKIINDKAAEVLAE